MKSQGKQATKKSPFLLVVDDANDVLQSAQPISGITYGQAH